MARLGTGLYETLKEKYGDILLGISSDPSTVERHQTAGRNVILADATDDDFWSNLRTGNVRVALLAMREYEENLRMALRIRETTGDSEYIFAVADYPEQVEALRATGVNAAWDFDTEAGIGFAENVIAALGDDSILANWELTKSRVSEDGKAGCAGFDGN